MASHQYTFLDPEEEEAYLAHLDGNNSLQQAADAIGICYDRIQWHCKHYKAFNKKVMAYKKEFAARQASHLNPRQRLMAGKELSPEKQELVRYWIARGRSEIDACVKAGCDITEHELTKVRDNQYNSTITQEKANFQTVTTHKLEQKLIKLLLENWQETSIEYRCKLNNRGKPILDKNGNARLYIHKIISKTLPAAQAQALISVVSKLIPNYTQKIEVASTNVNINSSTPNDVKTIILERLKSLSQKKGEQQLELITEVSDTEFVIKDNQTTNDTQ